MMASVSFVLKKPFWKQAIIAALLTPFVWMAEARAFTDVPSDRWGYEYIQIISENGITSGCDSENYCPDSDLQRAEMAIFLLRSLNGSDYAPPTATGTTFDDVSANFWAANFVERLSELGITAGCDASNFCPSRDITRSEMAIFLLRTKYGSDYSPPTATGSVFGDISSDYWAAAFIEQLDSEGISDDTLDTTRTCDTGNFCPSLTINRAEMAVFLVKAFNLVSTSLTGDADNGSTLFSSQGCSTGSCHGSDISANLNNIQNGTSQDAISAALTGVSQMAAMGFSLTDQEIADLSAHITANIPTVITGDASSGGTLFASQGCSTGSCHGSDISANLNNIQNGTSSDAISTALTSVGQMVAMGFSLTDQEIADLAAYITDSIPLTGDSSNGGTLFASQGCSTGSCHGSDISVNLNNIQNGTSADTISTALTSVGQMVAMGFSLTDQEIADLAAYITDNIPTVITGDAANGATLYVAQGCSTGSCHGSDPSLGRNDILRGDNSTTLARSMTQVSEMRAMGYDFSEQELADMAAYIATF
ncbi:MAG: c-type cytochrome [Magnetococcales bacterium]|nr:c-type cytochrome [Magnetococcales bacterium]